MSDRRPHRPATELQAVRRPPAPRQRRPAPHLRAALLVAALAAAGVARADIATAGYGGVLGSYNIAVMDAPARAETSYDYAGGSGHFAIAYHAEAFAHSLPAGYSGGSGQVVASAGVSGNQIIEAYSAASLTYAVIADVNQPPPFLPDFLPLGFDYYVKGNTRPGSTGNAFLNIGGASVLAEPLSDVFDMRDRVTMDVAPGFYLQVVKSVGCYVANPSARFDAPASSHCLVIMDPVASFDQATFDARWGAASFPLADYFSLSSGAPVDEPASALLLGLGLLGLLASGSRRRAATRQPVNAQA